LTLRAVLNLCITSVLCAYLTSTAPCPVFAEAYFEDGYLGLTQSELRAKLGAPQSVRDRKSALRVFNYYSFSDWEQYYKKLVAPQP